MNKGIIISYFHRFSAVSQFIICRVVAKRWQQPNENEHTSNKEGKGRHIYSIRHYTLHATERKETNTSHIERGDNPYLA